MSKNREKTVDTESTGKNRTPWMIATIVAAIIIIIAVIVGLVVYVNRDSNDSVQDFGLNDTDLTITKQAKGDDTDVDISVGEAIEGKNRKPHQLVQPPYNPNAPQSQWPSTLFRKNMQKAFDRYYFLVYTKTGYQLWLKNPHKWRFDLTRVASQELVQDAAYRMRGIKATPPHKMYENFTTVEEQRVRLCGYYDCVIDIRKKDNQFPRPPIGQLERWVSYGVKQFNKDPNDWRVIKQVPTSWKRRS